MLVLIWTLLMISDHFSLRRDFLFLKMSEQEMIQNKNNNPSLWKGQEVQLWFIHGLKNSSERRNHVLLDRVMSEPAGSPQAGSAPLCLFWVYRLISKNRCCFPTSRQPNQNPSGTVSGSKQSRRFGFPSGSVNRWSCESEPVLTETNSGCVIKTQQRGRNQRPLKF